MSRARLARGREAGTWDSALSSEEFAALRGVGFGPAGQVFGAAVHHMFGLAPAPQPGCAAERPNGRGVAVSGPRGARPFGAVVRRVREAWQTAIGRMAAECAELGAHGVVGVRVSVTPIDLDGSVTAGPIASAEGVRAGVRVRAIGTAVRAVRAPAPPRPFVAALSGQDFAKLVASGWVPVGLAYALSIGTGHLDDSAVAQSRLLAGNTELPAHTEVVNATRRDACAQLEDEVRAVGGEGAVVSGMGMCRSVIGCATWNGRADVLTEVTVTGTVVASFAARTCSPPLAVLPLGRTGSATNVGKIH